MAHEDFVPRKNVVTFQSRNYKIKDGMIRCMERVHVLVHGLVQGIGFRWFVQEAGRKYYLSGWVRNLPDGSVELEAQGHRRDIDDFLLFIQHGHPDARITGLAPEWLPETKVPEPDFSIKF